MPSCCIKNCKGRTGSCTWENKVSVYYFPKDLELKRQWLEACQKEEADVNFRYVTVCERHFLPHCFEAKWTHPNVKKQRRIIQRLKKGSIPTEFLNLAANEKILDRKEPHEKMPRTTAKPTDNEIVASARNEVIGLTTIKVEGEVPATSGDCPPDCIEEKLTHPRSKHLPRILRCLKKGSTPTKLLNLAANKKVPERDEPLEKMPRTTAKPTDKEVVASARTEAIGVTTGNLNSVIKVEREAQAISGDGLPVVAVCERHFLPDCIEEKWTHSGSMYLPRIIPRLEEGSTPTKLRNLAANIEVLDRNESQEKMPCTTAKPTDNGCARTAVVGVAAVNLNSVVKAKGNVQATSGDGLPVEPIKVYQQYYIQPNTETNMILERLKQLEEQNKKLIEENQQLRKKEEERKQLAKDNQQLKKNAKTIAYDTLRRVFTPGQTKKLLSPHTSRVIWSAEDISSAIALRSISVEAYNYIRKVKNIPLPCVQTLRNWDAHFDAKPGALEDVLEIMKIKGRDLPAIEKLAVLSFDQVDLERKQHKIYGPHKTSQFVGARGLVGNWRQPNFYEYDKPMTRDILLNIIARLQEAGYTVVAVTSNLGPTNTGLWKSLNIGVEIPNDMNCQALGTVKEKKRCFFCHPSNENWKVYVFANTRHLIKLARNNLFDSGYIVDQQLISKAILEELLALSSSDSKIAVNLTKVHLDVKGNQRRQIKFAAQVFSNRNAKAIEYCGKQGFISGKNWQVMSNVLSIFNDWFDIFNCQYKFSKQSGLDAYGVDLQKQDAILHKMDELVMNMRTPERSTLLPFQKGILLSNESLRELLKYIKKEYSNDADSPIEYLITRRLSQNVFNGATCLGTKKLAKL